VRTRTAPSRQSNRLLGYRVYGYCAPTYSIVSSSLWAIDILAETRIHLRLQHFSYSPRALRYTLSTTIPISYHYSFQLGVGISHRHGCRVYFCTRSQVDEYLSRAGFRVESCEIYGQLYCVESKVL